jgi:hypothetical protein
MVKLPFNLLRSLIDPTDPTTSMKHIAFGLVIAFTCLWLSWSLFVVEKITTEWNYALGLLLAAVTTSKVVGSGPSPAPTAGAVPSTVAVLPVNEGLSDGQSPK